MINYASLKPSDITCSPCDFQVAEICLQSGVKTRRDIVQQVSKAISLTINPEDKDAGVISPENVRKIMLFAKQVAKKFGIKTKNIQRKDIWNKLNESDNFFDRGLAVALIQHLLHQTDIHGGMDSVLRLKAKNIADSIFTGPIEKFLSMDGWVVDVRDDFLEAMGKLEIKTMGQLLDDWSDYLWEHVCEDEQAKHVYNIVEVLSGSYGIPLVRWGVGKYEGWDEHVKSFSKRIGS